MKEILILLSLIALVSADVYMHMFRGSNNRLNEQGRERNNANRLFDSQNNNRGGYNVGTGKEYYYQGSVMPIEWTAQHSCSGTTDDTKNNAGCELILQYMCAEKLRDGTRTRTIGTNDNQENDQSKGMHEDPQYYKHCRYRQRNFGLFTADQLSENNNANRNAAINTRQNPKGTRRGLECPEERDYYPYWGPSPWRDIAIMTNDVSRCALYKAESQNVKSKFYCVPANINQNRNRNNRIPITQAACQAAGGTWTEVPAFGIPAPDCIAATPSRDNHNGNGPGGFANTYNWTLPNDPDMLGNKRCAVRLRYNISTADFKAWTDANGAGATQAQNDEQTDLKPIVGLTNQADMTARGFVFKNNAKNDNLQVEVLPGPTSDNAAAAGVQPTAQEQDKIKLQLAINTAQLARTFQDRSHSFKVRAKPAEVAADAPPIQNINVRGKRGNIVQVYPAVEYDFTPNRAIVENGQYIHIQWDGSNRNPRNNDGQGRRGTDRSNMVLLEKPAYDEGGANAASKKDTGAWGRSYPEQVTTATLLNLPAGPASTQGTALDVALTPTGDELNSESTYYDMGLKKVEVPAPGTAVYNYLCTRNNNFSNRSQKGKISVVAPGTTTAAVNKINSHGGNITLASGEVVEFEEAVLSEMREIKMERWEEMECRKYLTKNQGKIHGSGHCLVVYPHRSFITPGRFMNIRMKVPRKTHAWDWHIFHSLDHKTWTKVHHVKFVNGYAEFKTTTGGVFVTAHEWNWHFIGGVSAAAVVCVVLFAALVVMIRKRNKNQIV